MEIALIVFFCFFVIYALSKSNKKTMIDVKIEALENRPRAFRSLKKLAESGDPKAQVELGYAYQEGRLDLYGEDYEIDINHDLAEYWYRQAAKRKYPDAFQSLVLLFQINGQRNKYADALIASAAFGIPNDMRYLGQCYLRGLEGFPVDTSAGIEWIRRSAKLEDSQAQKELADEYRRGFFVEKNLVKAYMWYSIAAQKEEQRLWDNYTAQVKNFREPAGSAYYDVMKPRPPSPPEAKIARDTIAVEMTADQIADAKRLAELCISKNYVGFD